MAEQLETTPATIEDPEAPGLSPEKHGSLTGGAMSEEIFASSRKVLSRHRGAGAFTGLQQWFTPPEGAQLISSVFGGPESILDPTAGAGSLLAPYPEERRFGIEIDGDHAQNAPYTAVHGDAQSVVPMLRAAGVRFAAIAANPPFGLAWRDPVHGTKGRPNKEINSALLAYLWSLDLLSVNGQGALICGTTRLRKEILGRPEGAGIYAIVDIEGEFFPGVSLPVSIAFFVHSKNRAANRSTLSAVSDPAAKPSTPAPEVLRARRAELPYEATAIIEARGRLTGRVSPLGGFASSLQSTFHTVGREHAERAKDAQKARAKHRHDLTLKGDKVGVGLSAYAQLALANAGIAADIRQLANQHVAYFGQNKRDWAKVQKASDDGHLKVAPELEERVKKVLAEAELLSTPLFKLKPQMRLGWLTDLDRIPCTRSDPERGYEAGEVYDLFTSSKITTHVERRVVENKNGEPELRKFETDRKILSVEIGPHTLDESNENIQYLTDHFDIPDPGDVCTRFPEVVSDRRELLKHIARKNDFKWRLFQLDHMSRMLVKQRGMLAHEQGLGKCVAGDTPVLINGALLKAADVWDRYSETTTTSDGEGEWAEPTEALLTTALADGKMSPATVSKLYRQKVSEWGRRVTLDDGSRITITNRHKLHCHDGWTLDIKAGDRVSVPRTIAWEGKPEDEDLTELLAWQIAEGYETPHLGSVQVSQKDVARLARLRKLALRLGDRYGLDMHSLLIQQPAAKTPFIGIYSRQYRTWLEREFGYRWGGKSAAKRIPDRLVAADKKTLRIFLQAFLAAEASVSPKTRIVELTSASRVLMDQVSLMLRRFGIWMRVTPKSKYATNGSGTRRTYYTGIIGGESLRLLDELVGIDDSTKAKKLHLAAAAPCNGNVGGVPVADVIQEARRATGLPWLHLTTSRAYAFNSGGASPRAALKIAAKLRAAASHGAGGRWRGPKGKPATQATLDSYKNVDRKKLLALADELTARAERDVYYARVLSVEPVHLEGYVYDFEVAGHHNYVAGGMMAHNTVQLMGLTEATIRLGADPQALFVIPQDLTNQWIREGKKFFNRRFEMISNPAEARDAARRAKSGEPGWFLTYFEALSLVGRRSEVLPHETLDHKESLRRRLHDYRRAKEDGSLTGPGTPREAVEDGYQGLAQGRILLPGTLLTDGGAQHKISCRPTNPRTKRLPEPPPIPAPALTNAAEDDDDEFLVATTRVACPKCGADTYRGWDGQVCKAPKRCVTHARGECPDDRTGCVIKGCGYTHRGLLVKPAYSHLTRAFKNGVVCVDEVSEIRGDDSLRSKSIRALAAGPHRYGATGTPLSNFIADAFWGLWFSLGNASPLFPYDYHGKAKFESDFCVIEYMNGKPDDGEDHLRKRRTILPQITNVSQFWRLAQPGISRCRKEQTGEPIVERTHHPITVPMGVAQKKMHAFWLTKFADYFRWRYPEHPMAVNGLVDKWAAALGQLWHLERAATLPASDTASTEWDEARDALDEPSNWTPANMKVLELAMKHAAAGEKVLIGSDLILTGKWLADRLNEKGVKAVHITEERGSGEDRKIGTKNPRKRAREIDEFVTGDAQVLCAGVAAMKLGHNLDVASTVILTGLPYSYMVSDQFIARVHRLTSKHPVSIYTVIPKGSLTERKWTLLKDKGGTSDLAFDGELSVQPEKPINWNKVLEDMKAAGIRSDGSEVLEADIEEAWRRLAPVVPLRPSRDTRPAPREQQDLLSAAGDYVQSALF